MTFAEIAQQFGGDTAVVLLMVAVLRNQIRNTTQIQAMKERLDRHSERPPTGQHAVPSSERHTPSEKPRGR